MAFSGVLTHRKTRRLAKILGIMPCFALGILEALWHLTAEQARDGSIQNLNPQDIADELFYDRDPNELIDALLESKWLERLSDGQLFIHDWDQHSTDTVDAWLARKGMRYANGVQPRMNRISDAEREKLCERFGFHRTKTHKNAQNTSQSETVENNCATTTTTSTTTSIELDKSNSADGEPPAKKPRKKRPPKPKGPPTPQQIRFQKIWDTLSALYEKKGWGQVMSADVNRYITKGVSGLGELLDWLESAKEAGKHDQDCQDAAVRMYLKSELEFDGKTTWEAVFNHRGKLWNQITGVSTAANNPYTEGTRYQRSGESAS